MAEDEAELALVIRAIIDGSTTQGCCEWQQRAARRLQNNPPAGLTLDGIRSRLCDFVKDEPTAVMQVKERRSEYSSDHRFYYKVILPVDGLSQGLFVELLLVDDEHDSPAVMIVNAHKQGS